jgi:hypothetical protein
LGKEAIECEYLYGQDCNAVEENEEAREARKISCSNDNESTCCYLCAHAQHCEISCNFLGENTNNPKEKVAVSEDTKEKHVLRCPICQTKMLQSEVKFRTGGWNGIWQLVTTWGELGEELLPLQVHACPKCGKVEFSAKPNTIQRVINKQ